MPDLLPLLEEIAAAGRTGLHYATNEYDRERYARLIDLAAEWYGETLDTPPAELRAKLAADLGPITPKVGADAAIFDDDGRILLMLRADNDRWCMPCGLMGPGETTADCAVRETREETGLEVRVVRLVDVFTRMPAAEYAPYTLVSIVYLCERVGGELRGSNEDRGLRYWTIEEVPEWHGRQHEHAIAAREAWRAWKQEAHR